MSADHLNGWAAIRRGAGFDFIHPKPRQHFLDLRDSLCEQVFEVATARERLLTAHLCLRQPPPRALSHGSDIDRT